MAEFFKTNTHLLTEHSMGWMLLKCLRMEMRGDTSGMMRAAKTGYALKSVLDFAEAGKKPMKDAARPFFNRLAEEPRVFAEYTAAYEDYCLKLKERAVAKKLEEEEERKGSDPSEEPTSLEEIPREQRLGPGGLDPVEVFESLSSRCRRRSRAGASTPCATTSTRFPCRRRGRTCAGWWTAACGSPRRGRRAPRFKTRSRGKRRTSELGFFCLQSTRTRAFPYSLD
jgi:hypothetical protein